MEPFGEWAQDQRIGELAALTANINRDSKKQPAPFVSDDFIPWRRRARDEQQPQKAATPEAQSALVAQTLFGAAARAGKKPKKK